ncbi:hypothetical protein [Sulfitobacter geojensis]|jgi:hypothetical protein|uniref:hypothetical protein n=1 Tax=Sulfitobacter geojensis TaxID=1342299 RepID=UPI0036DBE6F3
MSAMNTVAIVEDFRGSLQADEARIKERMAGLIRLTVEASVGVAVPSGMEDTDHYTMLRGAPSQMTPVNIGIDHETSIEQRLDAAADMLFGSYD